MFVSRKVVFVVGLLLVSLFVFVSWQTIDKRTYLKEISRLHFMKYKQNRHTGDHQHIGTNQNELTKWSPPTVPEYLQKLEQDNTDLAEYISKTWIFTPFTGPRQLQSPQKVDYSQRGQSTYIDNLLKQRKGGFFIECGAASGEGLSNSLFFEKEREWTGILIEANPSYFKEILQKRRHAYMLNACLSPTTQPLLLDFTLARSIGGLTNLIVDSHLERIYREKGNNVSSTKVQCFPLLSILKAININHVDYFSLDIEGAEIEVLKTFPFDKVQVDVITVEYKVSGNPVASQKKNTDIKELLVEKYGYQVSPYHIGEDILLTKGV